MEGGISERNRPGLILLGLGVFGLIFILSFGYSQLSFDAYTQASSRSADLQARLDEFIVVRSKVNSVVDALTDKTTHFANPATAIDQRVWNLQNAWNDLRDDPRHGGAWGRLLAPAASPLDKGIEQFAAAALRHAVALRRGDVDRAEQQVQAVLQETAGLNPQLSAFQKNVVDSIDAAETEKANARFGMSYGQSIATGAFWAFALLSGVALAGIGLRNLKDWIGRSEAELGTVAAVSSKYASPQR